MVFEMGLELTWTWTLGLYIIHIV